MKFSLSYNYQLSTWSMLAAEHFGFLSHPNIGSSLLVFVVVVAWQENKNDGTTKNCPTRCCPKSLATESPNFFSNSIGFTFSSFQVPKIIISSIWKRGMIYWIANWQIAHVGPFSFCFCFLPSLNWLWWCMMQRQISPTVYSLKQQIKFFKAWCIILTTEEN